MSVLEHDLPHFIPNRPHHHSFSIEYSLSSGKLWEHYEAEITKIFSVTTGGSLLNSLELTRQLTRIKSDISHYATVVCLLKNATTGELVGFTSAEKNPPGFIGERETLGLDLSEYIEIQKKTAQVGWTIILPEYRGKGGWSQLMDNLDSQLKSFEFLYETRCVRVEDDYAEKVRRRYNQRILCDLPSPPWANLGEQRFFRIRL